MEGGLDPSTGKQLEGLEKEQMIGMPLLEVARGQAELEADNVQKMMQALAGAVPREKKKGRKPIRLLFYPYARFASWAAGWSSRSARSL